MSIDEATHTAEARQIVARSGNGVRVKEKGSHGNNYDDNIIHESIDNEADDWNMRLLQR